MPQRVVFVAGLSLCLAACGGGGQSNSTATASPTSAESGTPAPGGTPISAPTPTADPNLLSAGNGTILRSYSPAVLDGMNDGNLANAAGGIGTELPDAAKPPFVFTFELPGPATINGFQASLRDAAANGPTPSVAFAVSTTGADRGFSDVGTIASGSTTLSANTQARWVRVTANQLFNSVGATGTIAPPPALDPTGIFVEDIYPDKNGAFVTTGAHDGDRRVRFVRVGTALVGTECTQTDLFGPYIGQLAGRNWSARYPGNTHGNPTAVRAVVNDDASIIAGTNEGGTAIFFSRTTERPAFCMARSSGTGPHGILVLDQDPMGTFYPADSQVPFAGYTFTSIGASMFDGSALVGKEAAIARDTCKVPDLMAPEQQALLLQWVTAGHKLLLAGGECGNGSDFTWLPYPFTSVGPGPETTHASLIQIENSALGTNDKNDTPHFVDVNAYAQGANNNLVNAAAVTTTDPHWCGHLFVAKPTNVNGFVQTYAVDGGGILIYDGFNGDNDNPTLQRIRQLEVALPVPAGLPCTELVTESFILEPNGEASFAAGSAQTIRLPMEVLANQGWSGPVTITTAGDLPATVSPNNFNLAGGTMDLTVAVRIPASAKAGVYTVNVNASNGAGRTARASVTLTGNAPLKKQLTPTQKRIRIYGIHFDVDSAVIQARSEPVIGEIAQIMRENPSWHFQIEGHTDSDGGAAYNLALSQRRAQAVVDDLTKRYEIARSRMIAKGYGLTRPIASNATDEGKALNRRVELVRL
jgi:outer membrane protein OmpA-like peptidoglycan-associated protein